MIVRPERNYDFKCAECGKWFTVSTSKRMGTLAVKCAHCGFEQTVSIISKVGSSDEPVEKFHTQMPVRVLGKAIQRGDKYIIENRAKIGHPTSFICPKCNKPIAIKPQQPGEQVITCKVCNAKVHITAYDAEEEEVRKKQEEDRRRQEELRRQEEERKKREEERKRQEEELRRQEEERKRREEEERKRQEEEMRNKPKGEDILEDPFSTPPVIVGPDYPQPERCDPPIVSDPGETIPAPQKRRLTNAELYWGGGFMKSGYKMRLLTGTTIIGRKDPVKKSDIQFNDPEMSRQSVQIDAEPRNGVMSFTLTVLKDLNPVLVNGRRVPQGMSVLLRSGVKIKMGQTTITFKLV